MIKLILIAKQESDGQVEHFAESVYFEARARLNNQLESQTIAALHAQ